MKKILYITLGMLFSIAQIQAKIETDPNKTKIFESYITEKPERISEHTKTFWKENKEKKEMLSKIINQDSNVKNIYKKLHTKKIQNIENKIEVAGKKKVHNIEKNIKKLVKIKKYEKALEQYEYLVGLLEFLETYLTNTQVHKLMLAQELAAALAQNPHNKNIKNLVEKITNNMAQGSQISTTMALKKIKTDKNIDPKEDSTFKELEAKTTRQLQELYTVLKSQ